MENMRHSPQRAGGAASSIQRAIDLLLSEADESDIDNDRELLQYVAYALKRHMDGNSGRRVPLEEWNHRQPNDHQTSVDNRIHLRRTEVFLERYLKAKLKIGNPSCRELAKLANLNKDTVHAIEKSRTRPHPKTIRKLAKVFRVPPGYLLGEGSEAERPPCIGIVAPSCSPTPRCYN